MKLKLKLDKHAIQTFLLENVEKIVFGGFALCFVLILYGAVRRDSYARRPADLVAGANSAEQHVQQTTPGSGRIDSIDYSKIAQRSQTPIKEEDFRFAVRWAPPLFEQTSVRKRPELYAVEELRVFADRGPVASDAGAGGAAGTAGGATQGQRWVVAVAAVPKKKQAEAFKQSLGDLASTATQEDLVPTYRSFIVERADVTGRSAADEPEWQDITEDRENADQSKGPAESVSEALIDPAIADPLPSLVGKAWNVGSIYHERLTGPALETVSENPNKYKGKKTTWQGEVNNADEATLIVFRTSSSEDPNAEAMFFAVEYGAKEAADSARSGGGVITVSGTVQGSKEVAIKTAGIDDSASATTQTKTVPLLKFDPAAAQVAVPGGRDSRDARRGERLPVDLDAAGEGRGEVPDYVLFRFFDFSVEPGKQYRYRVRLVLNNPNYKQDPRWLESPDLADDETFETPTSDASKPIFVPHDVRLLAGPVPIPQRAADPSERMLVVKWEEQNGLEAFHEFTAVRGIVADFTGCKFPEEKSQTRKPTPKTSKTKKAEGEEPAARTPVRGKKTIEGEELPSRPTRGSTREDEAGLPGTRDAGTPVETFSVDYLSGALVLDFSGGTLIAPGKDKNLTGPGEILVLDADGSLQVHRELDDKAEYDRRLNASVSSSPAQPRRRELRDPTL